MGSPRYRLAALIVLGLFTIMILRPAAGETVRIDQIPRIFALEVSHSDPEKLFLATPFGLLLASPDGTAERVSELSGALTSIVADPSRQNVFFASGHAEKEGHLGLLRSEDGGQTWSRVSEGARATAHFLGLDVSEADPSVMYGVFEELQVSRDGGKTWVSHGSLPERTYDFAVSPSDPETLYAATDKGLMRSGDGGESWTPAHTLLRPSSMVHTISDGTVYAFIAGVGLVRTKEPTVNWKTLSNEFGHRVLLRLAVDPRDANRLFAVADTGGLVMSQDGGRSWIGYEGHDKATPERIARGAHLYEQNCQSCHGVKGSGEPLENLAGQDVNPAPALDDSAHAWHHPDSDLVSVVFEGSLSRGGRMPGFKEILDREDAEDIVAYFKSLWSFPSYACQGARHMICLRNLHGPRK